MIDYEEALYKCKVCGKLFYTTQHAALHNTDKHKGKAQFIDLLETYNFE